MATTKAVQYVIRGMLNDVVITTEMRLQLAEFVVRCGQTTAKRLHVANELLCIEVQTIN